MRIFVGGRQAGKTTKLVEWLVAEPDRYLLTAYGRQHVEGIVREVLNRSVHPARNDFDRVVQGVMARVFTLDDMTIGRRPQARTQVWAIDDVDRVLESLVRGQVVQATHGADLQVEGV